MSEAGGTLDIKPERPSTKVELHAIYPDIKSELEKLTGWRIDFTHTFLLVSHSNFLSMVESKNLVAFAVGENYRIIIDSSRMNMNPFSLSVTAKHELAHLLLHHEINQTHLPRWLDEGFSQWASDGISEIIMGNRTFLTHAVVQKNLIPLREIAIYFPKYEAHMVLAYEQRKSVVEFIQKKFGAASLLSILHQMGTSPTATSPTSSIHRSPTNALTTTAVASRTAPDFCGRRSPPSARSGRNGSR